jgi:hypothetical protein
MPRLDNPLIVRVSPAGPAPGEITAELRRIVGPGRLRSLDPRRLKPDEMIVRIRELVPTAIVLDLATPPHTSAIRAALGAEFPILEVTSELRPVVGSEGTHARRMPVLGRRNDRGDVERLADGALDPRRP